MSIEVGKNDVTCYLVFNPEGGDNPYYKIKDIDEFLYKIPFDKSNDIEIMEGFVIYGEVAYCAKIFIVPCYYWTGHEFISVPSERIPGPDDAGI
jgi:hypothetical protein